MVATRLRQLDQNWSPLFLEKMSVVEIFINNKCSDASAQVAKAKKQIMNILVPR